MMDDWLTRLLNALPAGAIGLLVGLALALVIQRAKGVCLMVTHVA